MHEFYYEQSNFKVGGSENNLLIDFKVNEKEKIFEELMHSVDTLINFLQSKNEYDFIEIVEYEDG